MKLRSFLPRILRSDRPELTNLFDVYHPRTLAAVIDSRGLPLGQWSVGAADRIETSPRYILGLLRKRRDLRARFPLAIAGRDYRDWLLGEGSTKLGLSSARLACLAAAFAGDLGKRVRDVFLHWPDLQTRYPLALLPVGQKRFVKWLLRNGRKRHSLTDEAILWFLHETAEDLTRGVVETYLIHPEWQRRFPQALTELGQKEFLDWLCAQFPRYTPLQRVNCLPRTIIPASARGLNILGHFCYPSGLQQAALSTRAALEAVGWQTSCRDVPAGVRTLLGDRTKWLDLETYPITLINIAPVPHFEHCYERAGLARREHSYRIAYWYWELENIPSEWKRLARFANEIWAPTSFVAKAMFATMPLPVYDMLPGVSLGGIESVARASLGIPHDHFLFLFMFDMCSVFERKNPLGLIRAFRQAFAPHEKATLLIKALRGGADPVGLSMLTGSAREGRVVLIDEEATPEKALGYIALCDCFISLHRSEGFGLGLAQAMLMSKPVIGTNYSGNLAFMNRDNSLLVDYELVPIEADVPIYKAGSRWANPSEEHAAALMREVFEHRERAAERAGRAQPEIAAQLSLQAAGERMQARLEAISAAGLRTSV